MRKIALEELNENLVNNHRGLKREVWIWCRQNKIKYQKRWIVIPPSNDSNDVESFLDSLTFSVPCIEFETDEDIMAFKLRWM